MTERNIFEIACRKGFRYPYKGTTSTEDLFNMDKEELNEIFMKLKASLKSDEDSLLNKVSTKDADIKIQMEIVKYVFDSIVEAEEKAKTDVANSIEMKKILDELALREGEDIKNMSTEELQERYNTLKTGEI